MRFETQDLVFSVSVLNTGNQSVSFSNFAISNTLHFHFENTQNDTILLPGQGMEIEIAVNPQANTTVTEKFSFSTDINGMTTQEVVLLGEWQTVSVEEVNSERASLIYPNPTNGLVYIEWGNHTDFHITVYNQIGEMVLENQMSSNQSVDLSSFPPGVYHIRGFAENDQFQEVVIRK